MLQDRCEACGESFSGDDRVELIDAAFEHFSTVHADWGLNRVAVENYYDAKDRLSGAVERLDRIGTIEVHRVTPDRARDAIRFLDHDAFAGNPQWAQCYCMFFHREDPHENGNNPWQKNRADMEERLRTGRTTAYLAYVDGKPAGWCNASVRSAYPPRARGQGDDEVGVVSCFVIAPPYRKHGLSRRLLDAAVEGFREMGMKKVQAHPRLESPHDAGNFFGPLPLYLGAGFEIVEKKEVSAVVEKVL